VGEFLLLHLFTASCPALGAVAGSIPKLLSILRIRSEVGSGALLQRLLFLQNLTQQLRRDGAAGNPWVRSHLLIHPPAPLRRGRQPAPPPERRQRWKRAGTQEQKLCISPAVGQSRC